MRSFIAICITIHLMHRDPLHVIPRPNAPKRRQLKQLRPRDPYHEPQFSRGIAPTGPNREMMMPDYEIRPARGDDREAMLALLEATHLPPDGLDEQFPAAYAVAEADGRIVGAAGVEV